MHATKNLNEATPVGVPEPLADIGVGYLYHHYPNYQQFNSEFTAIGGNADIYEILGIQFNSEPGAIADFAQELGKPITLHSFEYCLGNCERPPAKVIDRIQNHAANANALYIGEHLAMMGTSDDYIGGFIQPLGTDEQTKVLIDNVKSAKDQSHCPLILENASQFYSQIGEQSISQQLATVSVEADVGILLSLSNISISENFKSQDRDKFLEEIPFDRVRQLHVLCGNTEEEQMSGMEKAKYEHEWAYSTMKELAKEDDFNPASVIFELETGTPSLPQPEKLRDYMDEARSLFFS